MYASTPFTVVFSIIVVTFYFGRLYETDSPTDIAQMLEPLLEFRSSLCLGKYCVERLFRYKELACQMSRGEAPKR